MRKFAFPPVTHLSQSMRIMHVGGMDEDFEDLIEQAFLDCQIDGATMELAYQLMHNYCQSQPM